MTANVSNEAGLSAGSETRVAKPVAVIDVGSTSVRMAIAEIDESGGVRTLETLSQAVNLGRDTFTRGEILKPTIEDCVRALTSYRRILTEYQITSPDQMRVVATSAVREAANRLAFLDRIYIATGFEVEAIDEAEVSRITYLGVQGQLKARPDVAEAKAIVAEVGGGSTELLVVQSGDVVFAHTYRLGSLRLRKTLEAYRAPQTKVRTIMQSQIHRAVEQVREHVPQGGPFEIIALGGDVRFAADQLIADWDPDTLERLPVDELESFTDRMLNLSVDRLIQVHHLTLPDAETLGPALLTYVSLARAFGMSHVLVSNVNLRDGLLKELALGETWSEEFRNQIVRAAVDLGRKFHFDEPHARHVAELCKQLFRALGDEHRLDSKYELILYVAALLHEIGLFIGTSSYHKHSMYLINNSELFGLGKKDVLLAALVSRYHRRAAPKPIHPGYSTLDRNGRVAVTKMSALLRVALALDDSRSQRVTQIQCAREKDRLVVTAANVDDLSIEQLALRQSGTLFEDTFGMKVLFRSGAR